MQTALALYGAAALLLLLTALLHLRPLLALARGNPVWRDLLAGGTLASAGLLLTGAPITPEAPGALYLAGGLLLLLGFHRLAAQVRRTAQWNS